MSAPSEIYVDPAGAADSGSGTIGDPYLDLQFALNSVTRDATNGDRFNVKAGTAEILSASLDFTAYGTPALSAPAIFQGYATVAGDGGMGSISGNAGNFPIVNNRNYVIFRDMELFNTGTAYVLVTGNFGNSLINCYIHTSSGGGVNAKTGTSIIAIRGCRFEEISAIGVLMGGGVLEDCDFRNGTTDFTTCVKANSGGVFGIVQRNMFSIDGATVGISLTGHSYSVQRNSILSAGGTGAGILSDGTVSVFGEILNNLIDGFSGAGGRGIRTDASSSDIIAYGGNAVYNCTTAYSIAGDVFANLGDNETLGSSPFAKSGADTFANRFIYFAPLDVGNVWGGAYPTGANLDKGALNHVAAGGGGGLAQRSRIFTGF